MNRMTSDNSWEMNMHQLALNQVYIGEDGWARYLKGPDEECSVCGLIRSAAEALGVELPIQDDEDLSSLLTDWLQYSEEEPEGVLAILYRALWAMAELRAKLSRYEDTGLEPEEITTAQPACVFYCNRRCNLSGDFCAEGPGCSFELDGANARKFLLQIKQPNVPLTLEDLREMDGEPVYIVSGQFKDWRIPNLVDEGAYKGFVRFTDKSAEPMNDYGKTWLAYRRKPEEGTQNNV